MGSLQKCSRFCCKRGSWKTSQTAGNRTSVGLKHHDVQALCNKVIPLKQQIMTTYIVLYVSTQISWKLHPPLLVLSAYSCIFRIQSIFKLNASLHPSNWTVSTMFKNIRQLFQQLRLQRNTITLNSNHTYTQINGNFYKFKTITVNEKVRTNCRHDKTTL